MENLFDNLFPIANNKYGEKNKIIKLEMEIEQLKLCLKMAQSSEIKRKASIDILIKRIEEQRALLDKFNAIMKEQNSTILRLNTIIEEQKEQLEHIKRIDSRMDNIRLEQNEILRFAKEYQNNISLTNTEKKC